MAKTNHTGHFAAMLAATRTTFGLTDADVDAAPPAPAPPAGRLADFATKRVPPKAPARKAAKPAGASAAALAWMAGGGWK